MDINKNKWISKYIKQGLRKTEFQENVDIHSRIFIVYGYLLQNVYASISLLGYQCGYPHLDKIIEHYDYQKSWIFVDFRGFLKILVWICYGLWILGPGFSLHFIL